MSEKKDIDWGEVLPPVIVGIFLGGLFAAGAAGNGAKPWVAAVIFVVIFFATWAFTNYWVNNSGTSHTRDDE